MAATEGLSRALLTLQILDPIFSLMFHSFVCLWFLDVKLHVPAGSPSRGGDVAVYVLDINQPSLPTPFILSLYQFLSL